MAISLASLKRGSALTPPTIMIYGPAGIGKTTIAAGAPNPVFAQIEDGLGILDAPTFGLLKTFKEFEEVIGVLAVEDHDFKTLVIDSIDWLEPLVWAETCELNPGWTSILTPGYGDGYTAALSVWRYILTGLDTLRTERGMGIIILAHAAIREFNSPETAPYDRYTPKLHESKKGIGANPLLQENVDCILFNNWRVSTVKDQTSNNKKDVGHTRGVSAGQRMIYTRERPSALAKNRYSMPPEITLPDDPNPASAWGAIAQYIPYYNQTAA